MRITAAKISTRTHNSESAQCIVCGNGSETAAHITDQCPPARQAWTALFQLYRRVTGCRVGMTRRAMLFGLLCAGSREDRLQPRQRELYQLLLHGTMIEAIWKSRTMYHFNRDRRQHNIHTIISTFNYILMHRIRGDLHLATSDDERSRLFDRFHRGVLIDCDDRGCYVRLRARLEPPI